jgi:low affinity Fe/Cu permease
MSGKPSKLFATFATTIGRWMGSHWALAAVALFVVAGLARFGIETTNIGISIATLLMVFILRNTQNRDSAALHLKLDEIITHLDGPRDDLAGIEAKPHEEIEALRDGSDGQGARRRPR